MKRLIGLFLSLAILFGIVAGPLGTVLAAPTNLIGNPSVETPNPSSPTSPTGWSQGGWGTNSSVFSYLSGGGEDGTYYTQVQTTSYTSGDAKWYFTPVNVTAGTQYNFSDYYKSTVPTEVVVQYQTAANVLSYNDLGSVPAAANWTQYNNNFTVPTGVTGLTVFHLIESIGTLDTDNYSLAAATAVTSAPTVNVTAPAASANLVGTVNITANAADTNGVKNVQFNVDGAAVGTPVTSAPYSYSWNTTGVTNGTHTITATATNINGVSTTSSPITVTVNNPVVAGTNLIPNPSVETVNPTQTTMPTGWQWGSWGTNTAAFNYVTTTGHTGTHSLSATMSGFTSGDGKWYFTPVSVTAGQTYSFSDYYEASVATDVMAVYIGTGGSTTYQDLGSAAASATTWKQFSASLIVPAGTQTMTVYHLIGANGTLTTDDYSLVASSLPSVSVNAPTAGSTVSGNVTLTATASSAVGIKSVQFNVDGVATGTPVTTSPYQYVWNSVATTNGTHSISATATDINGKTATSALVSVTVNNAVASTGNLIANPNVTVASPTNSALPANWSTDNWGTNTTAFTYAKTGGFGTSGSLKIQTTKYTDGDAKWSFDPITATQDEQYKYSEYYQSTVNTQVMAAFNMNDGSIVYQIIGLPNASTTWANFTTEFSAPQGTVNFTIYHILQSVGTLTTSDFSLTKYTPTGFSRPLLTLTFDDGYVNQYTQTMPLLKQYGFTSTQFIITDLLNTTGYLTNAEVESLYTSGNEIASHTVTHDDLTQETATQLKAEMAPSQAALKAITGQSPTDLAYPYGLYNNAVVAATKAVYTASRGVEDGLNSKDNFNAYDLKVQNVFNTTTTAQISDWVAQAQATNTWLIFVYHSVDPDTTSTIDGGIYNVTPTQLSAQLAAIKASGITVENMNTAYTEVTKQL